jgi:hypothetical protein
MGASVATFFGLQLDGGRIRELLRNCLRTGICAMCDGRV